MFALRKKPGLNRNKFKPEFFRFNLMGKEKQKRITVYKDTQLTVRGVFDVFRIREEVARSIWERKYFMFERGNSVREFPDGKELEMDFNAFKKVDDYVKFIITIKFLILKYNEVEVDGKVMGSGVAIISFTSEMEKDWKNRFRMEGFKNFLREVYEKYVIPDKLLRREKELWEETTAIMNAAKNVLEMYS